MKKLLVIDIEHYLKFYSSILERHKLFMIYAKNGDEGLRLLEKVKFDYLITTIVMPEIDGFQLLELLKENPQEYGKPKIAVCTGLGGEIFHQKMLKDFPNVFVINTFQRKIDEINQDIDKFLEFKTSKKKITEERIFKNNKKSIYPLTEKQMINFIYYLQSKTDEIYDVCAVEIIYDDLKKGLSFKEAVAEEKAPKGVIIDGNPDPWNIKVEKLGVRLFSIVIGCFPGPLTGDQGEWIVEFDKNDKVIFCVQTEYIIS